MKLTQSGLYVPENAGSLLYDSSGQALTYGKLEETYRIAGEIIDNLDDAAINEVIGSTDEKGLEQLFGTIINETYETLFGKHDKITTDAFGYLDKLTGNIEETLRCENINYFILSVLPEFDMNWHHIEWGDIVMMHNFFAVEAARGHGKSFFFSNAYPAWRLYKYKRGNVLQVPNLHTRLSQSGYIFSFSLSQAVDLLDILKETILSSDILTERLVSTNTKDGWNKTEIRTRNGAKVRVKGFGSSVRGAHPGWCIVDDPQKDNVMYSEVQRQKNINYFHSVIMNMPRAKGQVGVVGTPFHMTDLFGDLKTKRGWHVREYPAIFPDGRILWEQLFSYADLMVKRETQGNIIFSRELLCRPVSSESTIFPMEILNRALVRMENYTLVENRESFPIKFNKVVTGCDFAISANIGADYSVFSTWGIDEAGVMWLLNLQRTKGRSFSEQLAMLKSINRNFKPDVMYLEKNQFQVIFAQEAEAAGLPVFPHQTGGNKYDLRAGLPSLAIMFERGKIKLPTGDQKSVDIKDMIVLEFSSVTFTDKGLEGVGEHDDIAMSFWIATCAARHIDSSFDFSFI